MKGTVRKTALALTALIALAVALAAGLLWSGWPQDRIRRSLEAQAKARFGAPLTIDRLEIHLLPPSVRLHDVRLRLSGNRGSDLDTVVEGVGLRTGLLTFLGLRREPLQIAIDKPRLRLKLAEGRLLTLLQGGDAAHPGSAAAALALAPSGSRLTVSGAAIDLDIGGTWSGSLTGVDTSARLEAEGPALRGRLEFTGGSVRGPAGEWTGLGGDGNFTITGAGVRFEPVTLRAEGATISYRGTLAAAGAQGALELGIEMEKLARFFPEGTAPAGRLDARLSGGGAAGAVHAVGDLRVVALKLHGVEFDNLQAEIRLDDRLSLTGVRAIVLGGEATGALDVVRDGERFRVEADGRMDGIEVGQVLALAGWTGPPVRGTIHYRGRHTVDSSGIDSLSGSGVVDAIGTYAPPKGGELPLEITSTLTTRGDVVWLSGGSLRAGETRGSFSGTVSPAEGIRLKLSGATGNIAEILPLFAAPKPKTETSKPKSETPQPKTGTPKPKGRARVTPRDERRAFRALWRAGPRSRVVPAAVRLPAPPPIPLPAADRNPPVRTDGRAAAAAGEPGRGAPSGSPEGPLERIINALGGRWQWDGDVGYGHGGLSFSGTLSGTGIAFRGTPLGDLRARIDYGDETLRIDDASIDLPDGGTIHLAGRASFGDRGALGLDAEAIDFPLAPLLEVIGAPVPAVGRLRGRIALSGRPDRPSGRAIIESGTLSVAGVAFDGFTGDVLFTPDVVEVHDLTLMQGAGLLRLEGRIPYRDAAEWLAPEGAPPPRLSVRGVDIDLAAIAAPWPDRGLAGVATVEGAISGALTSPTGRFDLKMTGVAVRRIGLGEVTLAAVLTPGQVTIEGGIPQRGVTLDGTINYGAEKKATLRARVTDGRWKGIEFFPESPEEVELVLSGEAEVSGWPGEWSSLRGRALFEHLTLATAGVELRAAQPLQAELADGNLKFGPLVLTGDGSRLEARGSIGLEPEAPVDLEARGSLDLRVLRLFAHDLQASGRGEVALKVTGTRGGTALHGDLKVDGAAIRHPVLPSPLDDLSLFATFTDRGLQIESIEFLAGGGRVTGGGRVEFGRTAGARGLIREATIRLQGKDVKANVPTGFRSVSDIDLSLEHIDGRTTLRGTIDLVRGVYSRDLRLESNLGRRGPGGIVGAPVPPEEVAALSLDVTIRAPGDVWLRNDFGKVEFEGNVVVTGTAGRPVVTGRIAAEEGGSLRFRNVRYSVTQGTIDFDDPERFNPLFDLTGEATVSDYQINLRVTGHPDDFRYEVSSNPALPQQDIVALILTGRTLPGLGNTGAVRGVAAETASTALTSALSGELSSLLPERTGLDLVSIDPLQVNARGDPTTRVTLGKQVTQDLFVTYSAPLGGTTGAVYQLDYSLSRDVHFTTVRDGDGSIGGDFRLVFRQPPPASPGAGGGSSPKPPVVEALHLEGPLHFKEARVRRLLRIREGRRRSRADINDGVDRLLQRYRLRGFLMAEVDDELAPAGDDGIEVTVRIRPGPHINVDVKGGRFLGGLRQMADEAWTRGIFIEDTDESARAAIRAAVFDLGFRAAEVQSDVLQNDPDEYRVVYTVERGPRLRAGVVRVDGARGIPEEEILRRLSTRPQGAFRRGIVREPWLQQDLETLRALYRAQGFPEARVAPPEVTVDSQSGKARVIFKVSEGVRSIIDSVRFEGNRALDTALLAHKAALPPPGPPPDDPDDPQAVAEAAGRVRRAYDDRGFPDVRVTVRREPAATGDESTRRETIIFVIDEGRRQEVGNVDVAGNVFTRDKVIRKALTVKPGDPLSRADLLSSQTRLYGRGVFQSVSVEERAPAAPDAPVAGPEAGAPDAPERRDVRVLVRDAGRFSQTFGVGYDTEEKLRGQYAIFDRNLFGTGRYLGLQMRGSGLEQRAEVVFREKGILGGAYDGLASTFIEEETSPAFDGRTLGAAIQISRDFTRATQVLYRYSLRDVDLRRATTIPDVETVRLSGLGASVIHDTRDALFNPMRGHYLTAAFQYYGETIGSEADFDKFYAQAYFFKEILPRTIWAQAFRAGVAVTFGRSKADPASTGDQVSGLPPSERFYSGGDTSVRGFSRERLGPLDPPDDPNGDPIGGEGVFVLNEELRVPIYRRLQGVVFYDGGNVYRILSDFDPTDIRHVIGAGLRIATPIGPFRFEYGAILNRKPYEDRGQFFFSIGQAF